MQDNNNNSEESLFTQMFGQPSEQPKTEVKKETKTNQEINKNPFEDINNTNDLEQKKENSNNFFQSQELNLSEENTEKSLVPEEIIELSSNNLNQNNIVEENKRNILNEQTELNNLNFNTETQLQTHPKNNFQSNSYPSDQAPRFYPEETTSQPQNNQKTPKGNPSAGIILLVVLIGFIIYAVVDMNNQKKLENELIEPPKVTEVKKEPNTQEEKEETPALPTPSINFDEKLEFDKGLTNIPSELKQTNPFTPTNKTGVIRCDSKANIKNDYFTQKMSVYLYYEELLLKKYIQVSNLDFSNQNNYQLYKNSFQNLSTKHQNNEGFRVKYTLDPNNKRINATYYFNLAYGNKVSDSESKLYLKLYVDYNDKITSALGALLYAEDYVNKLECSSIITE